MKTAPIVTWLVLIFLAAGCQVGPKEIPYGNAECAYCRMSVVDRQHAAELVTKKGKVVFFDAIECLALYISEQSGPGYAHALVNDYAKPGALIPANEAYFLISKDLPSPMGAYLSAFSTKNAIDSAVAQHGGNTFNWDEILQMASSRTFSEGLNSK